MASGKVFSDLPPVYHISRQKKRREGISALSCEKTMDLFAQCGFLRDLFLYIVAGEGLLHQLPVRLLGEQTDQRDQYQTGQHGDGTGVDGGLQDGRIAGAEQHVAHHQQGTEQKADPAGGLGGLLPVQAIEERCQESTSQSAPGNAHQLRDKGDAAAILDQGQNRRNGDEHDDQNAHAQQLLFLAHVLDNGILQKVDGQRGAGGHNQRGERGHGSRQHQNHHQSDQQRRQAGQHGRDNGVVPFCGHIHLVGEQTAKAAQEIAAASHYHREHGGDNGALFDRGFILDGIELLYHLGQAPGAQRGEDDHKHQPQRIRAKEGIENTGGRGDRSVLHLSQTVQCLHKAALGIENRRDNGDNTHQHDQALDKVVDGCGHIAAGDHINGGQHRHQNDAHRIVDVERHAEQAGQTVIKRSGVRNQEDEDNGGSTDFQPAALEPLAEKVGHGGRFQVLGHNTGAAPQNDPRHQRADDRVADADPGGGNAEFPAELAGIADEDDGGKIRGAVGKRRQPRAHRAPAQHKAVYVCCVLAAVNADPYHHGEVEKQSNQLKHKENPSVAFQLSGWKAFMC